MQRQADKTFNEKFFAIIEFYNGVDSNDDAKIVLALIHSINDLINSNLEESEFEMNVDLANQYLNLWNNASTERRQIIVDDLRLLIEINKCLKLKSITSPQDFINTLDLSSIETAIKNLEKMDNSFQYANENLSFSDRCKLVPRKELRKLAERVLIVITLSLIITALILLAPIPALAGIASLLVCFMLPLPVLYLVSGIGSSAESIYSAMYKAPKEKIAKAKNADELYRSHATLFQLAKPCINEEKKDNLAIKKKL